MRPAAPIAVLTLVLSLAAPQARAHDKGPWPCQPDVERLCAGVEPGGGRLIKCLEEHWDEVSEDCKATKKGEGAKGEGGKGGTGGDKGREACMADKERLCAGAEHPGKCLEEHLDELSPECLAMKRGMKKEWSEKKGGVKEGGKGYEACLADKERLCQGADHPGMCLEEHMDELSPECRAMKQGMKGERKEPKEKKGAMRFEWEKDKGKKEEKKADAEDGD